jgi:hypothetical protein
VNSIVHIFRRRVLIINLSTKNLNDKRESNLKTVKDQVANLLNHQSLNDLTGEDFLELKIFYPLHKCMPNNLTVYF